MFHLASSLLSSLSFTDILYIDRGLLYLPYRQGNLVYICANFFISLLYSYSSFLSLTISPSP